MKSKNRDHRFLEEELIVNQNGWARVTRKSELQTYFNIYTGETLPIDFNYASIINEASKGWVTVETTDRKVTFYNIDTNKFAEQTFSLASDLGEELWAAVELSTDNWTFYNPEENKFAERTFELAHSENDGWAKVKLQDGSGWTLYNPSSDFLLPTRIPFTPDRCEWSFLCHIDPENYQYLPTSMFAKHKARELEKIDKLIRHQLTRIKPTIENGEDWDNYLAYLNKIDALMDEKRATEYAKLANKNKASQLLENPVAVETTPDDEDI